MKRLRYWLPLFCAVLLLVLPANSCGPDFPFAVFVLPNGPGGNYAAFANGRLGIPQQPYRTRHLVIAFDWLTHSPLTATEQKQAVAVDKSFTDPWSYEDSQKKAAPPSGFDTWIKARASIGPVDGYTPDAQLDVDRSMSGNQYDSFNNCLDDAFASATRTLAARAQAYGAKDPAVIEWVRGQDAVFSNCGDGKPKRYFGPGQPPSPPPAPHLPATLSNAAPWLQQDRAYQIAAAHFYATDFDIAITDFRAIAADPTSPWSIVSRYLIARSLIRKATLFDDQLTYRQGDAAKQAAAKTQLLSGLGLAQKELLAMRTDPRMAPMRTAIDDLLDYVNLRYQPDAQTVVLADRLHTPGIRNFGQALIDLTYLRTNPIDAYKPPAPHGPEHDAAGMIDWIDAMNHGDKEQALQHWHSTHSTVWLLAAITFAQPTDAATPELIHAAQSIPQSDPAWVAITFHRLRLMPRDKVTREQLLAVLPGIKQHQTRSTINLFTMLDATSAPTLNIWLATAGHIPADEGFGGPMSTDDTGPMSAPASEDVCGTKVKPGTTQLFDTEAASTLNLDFPLRLLAVAAESPILPENLRYQVAQAAWARAVLLDRPKIAHRMTPLLVNCRAAWKPVLAAYDAATTPQERKITGLLALMRFPSIEPSVREGEERRNDFAAYDSYRQNWWCTTVPQPGSTVDGWPLSQTPVSAPPPPLFLTPLDHVEATRELAALSAIPSGSQYLGTQALAWWKLYPHDPRTPDMLGEADRVVRNNCRDDKLTPLLAHQIFDALHHDYPQSAWAKRYKSWE